MFSWGDMGGHSRGDGSRVLISQLTDDAVVSWREQRVQAYDLFSRTERTSDA